MAVVTLDRIKAEQVMREVRSVLDKHQHDLIVEQRYVNGTCVATIINAVPKQKENISSIGG